MLETQKEIEMQILNIEEYSKQFKKNQKEEFEILKDKFDLIISKKEAGWNRRSTSLLVEDLPKSD